MPKVTRRTYKVYDWICPSCGQQQELFITDKKGKEFKSGNCIYCGSQRPMNDDSIWTSPKSGSSTEFSESLNTRLCAHCQVPFSATLSDCPKCGNPLDTDDSEAMVVNKPSGTIIPASEFLKKRASRTSTASSVLPVSVPKIERGFPPVAKLRETGGMFGNITLGTILGVLGVIGFCAVMFFLLFLGSKTHEENLTVEKLAWNRWVEVSYVETSTGTCWEGSCPSGYQELSRTSENYYSGEDVPVGSRTEVCEDCGSRQVYVGLGPEYLCDTNFVDGVEEDVYCQDEMYETEHYDTEVPVTIYATATPYKRDKIRYELDTTLTKNIQTGWIESGNPYWPEPRLSNEKLTGKRGGEYSVVFRSEKGEIRRQSFDEDKIWGSFYVGQNFPNSKVNTFGSIVELSP